MTARRVTPKTSAQMEESLQGSCGMRAGKPYGKMMDDSGKRPRREERQGAETRRGRESHVEVEVTAQPSEQKAVG